MRTSTQIQQEYDDLKARGQGQGKGGVDPQTDKAYQEAIRRAKLEEQAKAQRDFEVQVSAILDGTNEIVHSN